MQFKNLKLYRPVQDIIIPPAGIDGKNICLAIITENHNFLDAYRFMRIKPTHVKGVFVPTTKKPRTMLTAPYKERLQGHNLRPVKGFFGAYGKMIGHNFFLDISNFLNYTVMRYKIDKFGVGRGYAMVKSVLDTISGVPEDSFQRVLLYSIDLNSPVFPNIKRRKIFPVYMQILKSLKEGTSTPFDKVLIFFYNSSGSRFLLLYDKSKPTAITRIKSILQNLTSDNHEEVFEMEKETVANDTVDKASGMNQIPIDNKLNIKDAVRTLIDSDPSYSDVDVDKMDPDEMATAAIAYHVVGDPDKAKTLAKQTKNKSPEDKKMATEKLIKTFSDNMIPRAKARSTSTNEIVKMSKPGDLVDNKIPNHILEKRKKDFSELLKKDLVSTFKPLENADIPLKVTNIEVKTIKDSVSELKQTLKDRYFITLHGQDGVKHSVHIDIPHLTDNGVFLINGQPKILVNQIIAYPIFFFKPYLGRLESSYSVINIHSKRLAKTSYLMMRMSGYNLPIIMFLGYKLGFDETMKLFDVKYKIQEERSNDGYKLPNGNTIIFETDTDVGTELVQSFKYSLVHLPKSGDIRDINFWRNVLIKAIGTRNCTHGIDSVWRYILTPIVIEVLKSKGDPTTLPSIVKYICEEVVKGTVDDRNSLDKLRIRTSEVFTHTIQKQVLAAYSEYLAKKLGGDPDARLSINSTKAWSEVVNSPNVQQLETVNPLEELSMMTRITPVGIGGIPDKRSLPANAMNVHYTYYGNIDPLETPDSGMVGIQQHLAVGASIANARGTFMSKDRSMVKPSEILSVGPAMIPFVESNDGCRVLMGTGQSKQAIPLVDAQIPAVQTGYESILTPLLSDNFIKKSPVDGKVLSIESNHIVIEDKDRNKHTVETRPRVLRSGGGKHGLSVFKPSVEKGQIIKKDQIISEGSCIREGMIANGINLLCAFMPWKGYNYEDGVVISESAAKKFTSIHVEEKSVYIEEDDDVIFVANIGDKLEKGGILLTYSKSMYDVESYKHDRTEGGIISNIEIYSNVDNVPDKLKSIYEKFKEHFIMVNGKYPTGTFKEKDKKIEGILIKFVMKQEFKLSKADKMNNRHGNKGVVAIIEKDENMPVTPWGEKIDIINWPLGIANRMNSGQLCEAHTGLIAKRLGERALSLLREDFINEYERALDLLDGTENKQYSKNVIKKLKSLSDIQYKKIIGQIRNDGFVPIIIPPFKSPDRDKILDALGVVGLKPHYKLKLPEFNMITDPVCVGVVFVQKLEHMSSKKLSSRGVGPYVSTTLAPTAGKRRGGGQKVGESDLYGLLSWDCPILIDEFFGPMSGDHITKNEMVAEVIQNGTTEFRQAKTNPIKDRLGAFMLAIHLEETE